jgi:GTP-binding protein EngB required for normal cell division
MRKALGRRGGDLIDRIGGLERAVDAADGRLDGELVAATRTVVERASQRLRLSGDHTVVALAGATGSGKSSLFNALCGLDLAAVGVRRPTTSWALACAWGTDGAGDLLDWLGIPRRHQVSRGSLLDATEADSQLHGLVLLDLPDHDSTEVSHQVEVDRLVLMVDTLVWVLDPQKYADAAIHDRYLRPLATHRDIMLVVLNHVDELPAAQVGSCLRDVDRLLEEDGLGGTPVIATSARFGTGVAELRQALVGRVEAKRASRDRLVADVESAADRLAAVTGQANPGAVARSAEAGLVDTFAAAAGVPVVVQAVAQSTRTRARSATGWPVTKWLSRLRPDPLRRLHLDLGRDGRELTQAARTSLPQANKVQRARVDASVRAVVDEATVELPRPWAMAVRRASVSRFDDLGDALDNAVARTDLGVARTPLWWRTVSVLQWVLLAAVAVGGVWLALLFGLDYLRMPQPSTPQWRGIPWPTLLLVAGVLFGVLLAVLSRLLAALSARRRAAKADRRLRASIAEVVQALVVEPMEAEIDAYRRCRDGIAAARA